MLKRLRSIIKPPARLSAASALVKDSAGWAALTRRPQDYDPARIQEIYQDALEAWRKNPIAWRTVAITTDYVVGDQLSVSSPVRSLERFIRAFWNHSKNQMPLRLESMCDELSRSGDLFVLLFRNPQDGMSYVRFVTKDRIEHIETAANDWETELAYYEIQDMGAARVWYSPAGLQNLNRNPTARDPAAPDPSGEAVMLHYSINRPLGALMGEGDLTTLLPWLLRYSRMLEDRVRLHWAMRAFLWLVTVPSSRVKEKQEQYRNPPDGGSIVVKDESESWDVQAPNLHGADARHDMQAVRAMIDAGSGYPPHWRGDAGDISLATAQAMQGPTERHLRRRQRLFIYIIQDILYHAYTRAVEAGLARPLPEAAAGRAAYDRLFTIHLPDISRFDNEALARAARDLTQAFYSLSCQLPNLPPALAKEAVRLAFKFSGETIHPDLIDAILRDVAESRTAEISRKEPIPANPPTQPDLLNEDAGV